MVKSMKFQTPQDDLKYYLPNGGNMSPRAISMVIEYLQDHDDWSLIDEGDYVKSLLNKFPGHIQNTHLQGLIKTRLAWGVIEIAFRKRNKQNNEGEINV